MRMLARYSLSAWILLICSSVFAWADLKQGIAAFETGDYAAALKELRPLAEQGDAAAQNHLGLMYVKGTGVPQDYAEANRWFRLAAEQGYAKAQFNLGVFYNKGYGVPQDYDTAIRWYRLASKQGYEPAHGNLFTMYAEGNGVPKILLRLISGYVKRLTKEMGWFNLSSELIRLTGRAYPKITFRRFSC